jgi:hypothetical protein
LVAPTTKLSKVKAGVELRARQRGRAASGRRDGRSHRRGRRLGHRVRTHQLHHHRAPQLLAQRLLQVALEPLLHPVAPERAVQLQAHHIALDTDRRHLLQVPTARWGDLRQQRLHHIAPRLTQTRRVDVLPKSQLLRYTILPAHRCIGIPALASGGVAIY